MQIRKIFGGGGSYIYIFIVAILLLMFLRNALHIEIPVSVILLLSVIPVCIATPSQMMAMLMSFIPLATGFQYKYALLLYVIIGIIRFGKLLSISKVVPVVAAMMIWELAHVDDTFLMSEYLRSFAELLLLGFVTSIKWKEIDYKLIARSLAIATIGVSLIIIYIQINSGLGSLMDMLAQGAAEYRFGQNTTEEGTAFGLNFNANQLGFICNMSIAALLMLIARKEHSMLDITMVVALVFFGAMTLSRTFVAVALLLFVSYIFLLPGSYKQRSRNILLLLIIAPIFVWGIFEFAPSIIENFAARNDVDDITNGRAGLMAFYNDHIFSSFNNCFWGLGLQGYGSEIANLYGHQVEVCHNSIQELWVAWGFVGVLLFGLMVLYMIITSKRWSRNRTLFAFMPLCALLFSSMAGQLISSGSSLLSLSLTYIIMCLDWRQTSIHQKITDNYAQR